LSKFADAVYSQTLFPGGGLFLADDAGDLLMVGDDPLEPIPGGTAPAGIPRIADIASGAHPALSTWRCVLSSCVLVGVCRTHWQKCRRGNSTCRT